MDYTNILNKINNNCEETGTKLYIMEQNQRTLYSGDLIIIEKLQETNNNILMVNMCLILTLLFTFIMRCFK